LHQSTFVAAHSFLFNAPELKILCNISTGEDGPSLLLPEQPAELISLR
jgi:hypothetical protein